MNAAYITFCAMCSCGRALVLTDETDLDKAITNHKATCPEWEKK